MKDKEEAATFALEVLRGVGLNNDKVKWVLSSKIDLSLLGDEITKLLDKKEVPHPMLREGFTCYAISPIADEIARLNEYSIENNSFDCYLTLPRSLKNNWRVARAVKKALIKELEELDIQETLVGSDFEDFYSIEGKRFLKKGDEERAIELEKIKQSLISYGVAYYVYNNKTGKIKTIDNPYQYNLSLDPYNKLIHSYVKITKETE